MTVTTRARLLTGTGLLVLVQLGHLLDVLRYADGVSLAEVLNNPLAWTGIGVALAAFVAAAADHRTARPLGVMAGLAVSVGFLLYHGIPVDLGVNNPYWGTPGADADAIMWASVIVLIAVGAWTARVARVRDEAPSPAEPTRV
jgi:hypothetical protein